MAYKKGVSGNPAGRPKQTQQQKDEREHFKRLLKSSTVSALESIIAISQDRYNKDRFNACKFIIEKAYGANTAFLLDGTEDTSPVMIVVKPHKQENDEDWDEVLKASPDEDDLEDDEWEE
ncbi:MAG: DUF5681 domain-containing protein [Anaerovoracaceae bacterium]